MRLLSGHAGQIILELDPQEVSILDNLVSQLLALLQSHSSVDLDPDPLFASLEVGGTDRLPDDPALARLLPDAYETGDESGGFRRVTEQGLINRKLEDAMVVGAALSANAPANAHMDSVHPVSVAITAETFQPWIRTLTAVRLAVSARLGITHEDDHLKLADDPESSDALLIFEWLATLIEAVLHLENAFEEAIE